jgi:hypothetical protein
MGVRVSIVALLAAEVAAFGLRELSCLRLRRLGASTFDEKPKVENKVDSGSSRPPPTREQYDGSDTFDDDGWVGYMDGFDWQLEQARRLLEGPSFAPLRMTLWQPTTLDDAADRPKRPAPGLLDQTKILLNNAMQIAGIAESMDGAPMVQGVNTYNGSF